MCERTPSNERTTPPTKEIHAHGGPRITPHKQHWPK